EQVKRGDGIDFFHAVVGAAYASIMTLDKQWAARIGDLTHDVRRQVLKWPSMFLSQRDSMFFHAFRVFEQEWLEAVEIHMTPVKKFGHLPTGHEGKISAKQHSIEAGQDTMNLL